MLRIRNGMLFTLLCLTVGVSALAQDAALTRDEQLALVAPTSSGQTGLFTVVTADTLRRGEMNFGIYYQNWDLLAGEAREFAPLSARDYEDMSYDLYRLSASVGYGLTDRWEVNATVPFDRISGSGGDRAGYVNGYLYQGRFSDSGMGNVRLATKFGLMPNDNPTRVALSAYADLPTGDENSGIATGSGAFGVGLHWTRGIGTLGATYQINGDRSESDRNDGAFNGDFSVPNEVKVDGGLNIPLSRFGTTNWINELNAVVYTGGDRAPSGPVFLTTGLRHWFGNSGWALSAGARWNAAKFFDGNDECRVTELDDCSLSGLVGLTYSPFRLAAAAPLAPPAPAPLPPPPAPAPAPVPPPAEPVAPPRTPQELRTDEIHFEPASARLTNIAKAILDDVALRMKQEPTATAIVIGYTDNRENSGANADLDRRRAEAVRDYLVSRHGIDASRISVENRGINDPVGDNTTAEGRLRNRRVVIRLMLP